MSAPKRAKLQPNYSFLPNNVLGIHIKGHVDTKRLEKCMRNDAEYFGDVQPSKLKQKIEEKSSKNHFRFVSVQFPDHLRIYVVAHPSIGSENDLISILNTLIDSYEQKTTKKHQFRITNPQIDIFHQTETPFWENKLQNAQLDIDFSSHHTGIPDSGFGVIDFRINASEIQKFCDEFRVGAAVLFMCGFQLFVYKYSNQDVFSIKSFIGSCFQNSVCVPCTVNSEKTFLETLERIKNDFKEFSNVSNVPFHLIESEILKNRKNSLFFTFYHKFTVNSNGLDVNLHPYGLDSTFGAVFCDKIDEFRAEFHFDRELFSAEKVNIMAEHFKILLNECVQNPTKKLSNYSLLTTNDVKMLEKWNDTSETFDLDVCVHEMFENQVEKNGSKIALYSDRDYVTFTQLNDKIGHFTTNLHRLGANPGSVIGVFLEKSIDSIAIFVAILKTGSCYVAIDPTFPAERIKFLIENSKTTFLVTTKPLKHKIPQIKPIFTLESFTDARASTRHDTFSQTAPAYIVYTSGTTGNPKGVVTTHRNIITFTTGVAKVLKTTGPTGILLAASQNFCLFHGLLFFSLAEGHSAILAASLMHLPELAFKHKITLIATPPAGFRHLMDEKSLPESLNTVMFGGDVVPIDLIANLRENRPEIRIFCCHGCTEATLFDSCGIVGKKSLLSAGRPMPNMKLYVVDKHLNRLPVGFTGELCISGPQVVAGYLNLALETRENFIENPFCDTGSDFYGKLYRTGDLGRWTDDGHVIIVGRTNQVVKINGIRIGLNEIASVLAQHKSVSEAIVSVCEKNDARLLVAYHVPRSGFSLDELKRHLKSKLPRYMIPQIYIEMEKLPRNPNGKIDRNLLPPPSFPDRENMSENPKNDVRTSQTHTQTSTLACIHKLLQRPVSLTENLLENGLDSVLATRLVINLEKIFKIKIPVSLVYDSLDTMGLCNNIDLILGGNFEPRNDIDLLREAILSDDVISNMAHAYDLARPVKPNYILLTGSTGFLGAFILAELLRVTRAHVYCLVRAPDVKMATERLNRNLVFYGLWEEKFEKRMSAILGDVTKCRLGLTMQEYETMSSVIDSVYHSAATVNFILPYSAIKNDVIEILKFAFAVKIKPVHYISSIAVHGNNKYGVLRTKVYENTNLDETARYVPCNGYAQMKWVSEKLVKEAGSRGLPVTIFRPSFVGGNFETGSVSLQEFFVRLIKDCIEMECYPNVDVPLQLIPVDFVCKSVVKISFDADNFGKVFHLAPPCFVNDATVCQLMELVGHCGYKMEGIECGKWLEKLELNVNAALYPLLEFVKGYLTTNRDLFWDYDVTNVKNALERVENRKIDANYVKKLVDFLIKCNFVRKNDE